ncbi:MAG TPA: histidine kinase [Bryobacteraceae bacterium]|jgi:signal transduction histidine kinase|nr:histidine kinase [Bryobacteraceae bacterium]
MLVSAINAREVESDRISRTLHDEVGQVLSAVGLQLDALRLEFQGRVPEIGARTSEIQNMLEKAMQEVRALSYDLNPAVVERVGLQNALDRLVGRLRARFPGNLRFQYDPNVRVPLEVGNAWYKIAEHALENAITHSESNRVEVLVKGSRGQSVLEIRDHGKGFDFEQRRAQAPGLGLLLMEHYGAQSGVQLTITSTLGKGTVVRGVYSANREKSPLSKSDIGAEGDLG